MIHVVLSLFGAYAVGTTLPNQYVGSYREDEDVIEKELAEVGFERNPVACFKDLPDGRESEGSWVLRAHDDPLGRLGEDRQIHVTMYELEDGRGRELYAHEEYDWQDRPWAHYRAVDFRPRRGVEHTAELIENYTFLTPH